MIVGNTEDDIICGRMVRGHGYVFCRGGLATCFKPSELTKKPVASNSLPHSIAVPWFPLFSLLSFGCIHVGCDALSCDLLLYLGSVKTEGNIKTKPREDYQMYFYLLGL